MISMHFHPCIAGSENKTENETVKGMLRGPEEDVPSEPKKGDGDRLGIQPCIISLFVKKSVLSSEESAVL